MACDESSLTWVRIPPTRSRSTQLWSVPLSCRGHEPKSAVRVQGDVPLHPNTGLYSACIQWHIKGLDIIYFIDSRIREGMRNSESHQSLSDHYGLNTNVIIVPC